MCSFSQRLPSRDGTPPLTASSPYAHQDDYWIGNVGNSGTARPGGQCPDVPEPNLRLIVHTHRRKELRIRLSNRLGTSRWWSAAHILLVVQQRRTSTRRRTAPCCFGDTRQPQCRPDPWSSAIRLISMCQRCRISRSVSTFRRSRNDLAHAGTADELRLVRDGGLHGRGEVPGVEDDLFVAVPHRRRCRGIVARRRDRRIWIFDH